MCFKIGKARGCRKVEEIGARSPCLEQKTWCSQECGCLEELFKENRKL